MIKKKRYTIILSLILILEAVFLLLIPVLCSNLVDKAILYTKGENINLVFETLLLLIPGIGLVIMKTSYNFLYSSFSLKLEKEYKEYLYSNLIDKKYNEIRNYSTGKIELLFNQDIFNVIKNQLTTIPQFARELSRMLLAIIIIAFIDYKYLILILIFGIIGFMFAKIYSSKSRKLHRKVLDKDGKVSGFIIETNSQLKLIQAYDSKEYVNEHFLKLNNDLIDSKRKRNYLIYGANSGLYAFTTILYLFTICYGALSITVGLTYGSVLALIQLLSNIQNPFLSFSSLINNYNLSKTSLSRLNEALAMTENEKPIAINDFEAIVFENVSFSYDNENKVLDNFSIEIKKNDIVLLAGPSGRGKTTILMLLLGFIEPNSGSIYILSNNKKIKLDSKTRSLFGYVPQENILFSGSILENIYILTGKSKEEAIEGLKLANIYDEIMALPNGLDTELKERGAGLSLGQIQRILIAIALLKDSKILLLDEFSSALDSNNEDIIINNLKKLNKTIIYVTHRNKTIDNKKIVSLEE